jgi:hypothetical protein
MAVFRGTILDVSRRQNVVFWVSQLAVVFSTIVGVYLASSEGLKSAIEFHYATTTEKKFYTLGALRSELESNNSLILELGEKNLGWNDEGEAQFHRSMRVPDLNWFVWSTMTQSSESLDLPVDILRDVNIYYLALTKYAADYERSGGRDKLYNAVKLNKVATEAREGLLVRMESQLQRYSEKMSRYKGLGTQ